MYWTTIQMFFDPYKEIEQIWGAENLSEEDLIQKIVDVLRRINHKIAV